jgi:ribosome-associated heat shock protein Hsp15
MGGVTVNDRPAKPSRDLQVGDSVVVVQGIIRRTLEVRGAPPSRVGAKLVPTFCHETTPPEEFAKAREQRVQQLLARTDGGGRPTKRDRRTIERLFE